MACKRSTTIEISPIYLFDEIRIKDPGRKGHFRIRMGRYSGTNEWGIQAYLFRRTDVRPEDELDSNRRDILLVTERKYLEILKRIKKKHELDYVILYRGKIIE